MVQEVLQMVQNFVEEIDFFTFLLDGNVSEEVAPVEGRTENINVLLLDVVPENLIINNKDSDSTFVKILTKVT